MSIRFMLIDRDPASRHDIGLFLTGRSEFEKIGEASAIEEAVTKIRLLRPDVVFADVSLLQGLNFCTSSGYADDGKPILVFLSPYRHFALQAFDLGAADYLLKPIRQDRFEVCLARIRNQVDSRQQNTKCISKDASPREVPQALDEKLKHIAVKSRRRTVVLEPSEIDWIAAAGDYSEIHVAGAAHLLREPLSVLLSRLPPDVFFRIHRSFVVNLDRVSGFKALRNQDFLVRMKDRAILRASRTFSEDFRSAIARQGTRRVTNLDSFALSNNSGAQSAIYA